MPYVSNFEVPHYSSMYVCMYVCTYLHTNIQVESQWRGLGWTGFVRGGERAEGGHGAAGVDSGELTTLPTALAFSAGYMRPHCEFERIPRRVIGASANYREHGVLRGRALFKARGRVIILRVIVTSNNSTVTLTDTDD